VITTSRQVGGALGVALMGAIVAAAETVPQSDPRFGLQFVHGFQHALETGAAITLTGAVAAALLVRRERAGKEQPPPAVAKLVNVAPILSSADARRTAAYYHGVLGFDVVEHYEASEPFAALYRDDVEIVVVETRRGDVESNLDRYGAGYDLYLDPETVEDVDLLYAEFRHAGAQILLEPALTPYGSYEFAVEDIDGHRIGIGRIADDAAFFGPPSTDAAAGPPVKRTERP